MVRELCCGLRMQDYNGQDRKGTDDARGELSVYFAVVRCNLRGMVKAISFMVPPLEVVES